jgi:small subunit ribosomal protein S6
VAKLHKAHYVLMNLECSDGVLRELESSFKFNDAVIRKLVVRKDAAESDQSPLFKAPEEDKKPEFKTRNAEAAAESVESADADESATEEGV